MEQEQEDFLLHKKEKKCKNYFNYSLFLIIFILRAEVKREIAELEALLAGATQV